MLADLLLKVAGMNQKPEQDYRPRPSSSGPERCLRQLCYKAHGLKAKKMSDRFVAVLDDSSWHEELTADWIRKSAFQLHSQQLVLNCGKTTHLGQAFDVVGSIDGIITDLLGVDRLWEHKAINHFGFERYLKGAYPMDYLTQCCLYLVGLQKVNPQIREAILLIKNKNTSAYLEFLLDYNSADDIMVVKHLMGSDGTFRDGEDVAVFTNLYRDAFDRFAQVEKHRVLQALPDRQFERSDWQCDYCPYSEPCYENYQQEFTEFVALDAEAAAQAAEYVEINDIQATLKKRQDVIKKSLKGWLNSANACRAIADGYSVNLAFQKRTTVDNKLIPAEILKKASDEKTIEIFTIKGGKA